MAVVKKVRKGGVSFSSRKEEPASNKEVARSLNRNRMMESFFPGPMPNFDMPRQASEGISEFEMSPDITKLLQAFIRFRKDCPNPKKNRQGYNYNYVDLANIIENTQELLNDQGLAVMQFPVSDGSVSSTDMNQLSEDESTTRTVSNTRGIGVLTMLVHESGQYIRCRYTMPSPSMSGSNFTQEAGACITYARRYALTAVLCLAADEDTDASFERAPAPTKRKKKG